MATRFRALAAPIDVSTGDRRRFGDGLTVAPTPLPLRWPREDVGGHDGAVTIGKIDKVQMSDNEVWVEGTIFDDIDRDRMPRLAEDVATAMTLVREGVLGLSVDLDDFDAVPVQVGSNDPVDMEMLEDPETELELLVTRGRIRAATLVDIPAYVETNHTFELYDDDAEVISEDGDEIVIELQGDTDAHAALVASVAALDATFPAAAFEPPVEITGPTPITYDWDKGVVYGHIALRHTCHVGFKDTCVLPPIDESGEYPFFNRIPIETENGPVFAGRITVGGRHAELNLSADAAVRTYDEKTEAAFPRATTDKWGIFVCGPIRPDLDDRTVRVLGRRKVSGDWREKSEGLALMEVLALSPGPRLYSEPGFPVATHSHRGRQTALVASFGPEPEGAPQRVEVGEIVREAFGAFLEAQAEENAKGKLREELAALMGVDADKMREELARTIGA